MNQEPVAWQETDVYWKPLEAFSTNPEAFAYKRPLYATPVPATDAREWQPIETAPKDGTNILLVNYKGNIASGLWQEGLLGVGWFLRGGNKPDTFFNGHHGPTHWMPLPDAPK